MSQSPGVWRVPVWNFNLRSVSDATKKLKQRFTRTKGAISVYFNLAGCRLYCGYYINPTERFQVKLSRIFTVKQIHILFSNSSFFYYDLFMLAIMAFE